MRGHHGVQMFADLIVCSPKPRVLPCLTGVLRFWVSVLHWLGLAPEPTGDFHEEAN